MNSLDCNCRRTVGRLKHRNCQATAGQASCCWLQAPEACTGGEHTGTRAAAPPRTCRVCTSPHITGRSTDPTGRETSQTEAAPKPRGNALRGRITETNGFFQTCLRKSRKRGEDVFFTEKTIMGAQASMTSSREREGVLWHFTRARAPKTR